MKSKVGTLYNITFSLIPIEWLRNIQQQITLLKFCSDKRYSAQTKENTWMSQNKISFIL